MKRKRTKFPARHYLRWTADEIAYLKREWGDVSHATLVRTLKRTPWAVEEKARRIGLSIGVPQGGVFVTAFAREAGYNVETVRKILALKNVRVRPVAKRNCFAWQRRYMGWVDHADAMAALEEYLHEGWETAAEAARRLRCDRDQLRKAASLCRGTMPERERLTSAMWTELRKSIFWKATTRRRTL